MSRTGGEGRAPSEKSQRVFETAAARKARRDKRRAETEAWQAQNGPVITHKIEEK